MAKNHVQKEGARHWDTDSALTGKRAPGEDSGGSQQQGAGGGCGRGVGGGAWRRVQEGIRGGMGEGCGRSVGGVGGGAGHTFQVDVSWKALLLCPPTIIDY